MLLVLDYFGALSLTSIALQEMKVPLSSQALTAFATSALRPMAGVLMAGELIRSHFIEAREAMLALALGKLAFLTTQDLPRNVSPLYASFYPIKTAAKLLALLVLRTALST